MVEPTTGARGVVCGANGLSGVATGEIASALSQASCRALETAQSSDKSELVIRVGPVTSGLINEKPELV